MRVGVPPKGAALSDKYLVRILKTAPVAPGKESAKIFIICSSAADCCLKILDFENNLICWWHETGTFMLIGFIIMASLVITNLLRLEKVRICNILDILSLSKTQSSYHYHGRVIIIITIIYDLQENWLTYTAS